MEEGIRGRDELMRGSEEGMYAWRRGSGEGMN
jgi:hypothetical protein